MQTYFHIGLHKTGTTFLQREVFPKIAAPGFGFFGKLSKVLKRLIYQDPAYFDAGGARDEILREIGGAEVALASNEDLSGDPFNGGIHRSSILANLHGCFPRARIILLIRRQDEWALSNYLGSIRRGSTLALKRTFEPALNDDKAWLRRYPNPTLELFRYSPYLRRLQALFGEVNVLVLPYEMLRSDPDRAIARICGFMTVAPPAYRSIERNVSWGRHRVALRRVVNLFVRSPQNPHGFLEGIPFYSREAGEWQQVPLRRLLAKVGLIDSYDGLLRRLDRRFVDKQGVCRSILSKCIDDNRRIQSDFGIDLERYGYLDAAPLR
jgi:hypothetical protein